MQAEVLRSLVFQVAFRFVKGRLLGSCFDLVSKVSRLGPWGVRMGFLGDTKSTY